MKPLLILPSGVLSAKELKDIQDAGYLTVVTDEPNKVKCIKPDEPEFMGLTKDKFIAAMMRVLYNSKGVEADYMREWLLRITLSEMGAVKDKEKTATT